LEVGPQQHKFFIIMKETGKLSDFVVVDDPDELCAVPDESCAEGNDPDTSCVERTTVIGQEESRHQTGAILRCRLVITATVQNEAQGESKTGLKAMSMYPSK
jgi:hypothetical protein